MNNEPTVLDTAASLANDPRRANERSTIDQHLFDQLRALRRQLAEREGAPLYMILSNASLEAIATYFPQTKEQLSLIKGLGKYKIYKYGDQLLSVITPYCKKHQLTSLVHLLPKPEKAERVPSGQKSIEQTLALFQQGLTIDGIAVKRKLSTKTIMSHLLQAYANGAEISIDSFVPIDKQHRLIDIFKQLGTQQLTIVMEYLTNGYSFDDLRWVRAKMQRELNGQLTLA